MDAFLKQLRAKNINVESAISIITEAVKAAQKAPADQRREAVEDMIRTLAAGVDKKQGTADDLVPPETVETLIKLLDLGVVGDLADALAGSPLSKIRCWSCC